MAFPLFQQTPSKGESVDVYFFCHTPLHGQVQKSHRGSMEVSKTQQRVSGARGQEGCKGIRYTGPQHKKLTYTDLMQVKVHCKGTWKIPTPCEIPVP